MGVDTAPAGAAGGRGCVTPPAGCSRPWTPRRRAAGGYGLPSRRSCSRPAAGRASRRPTGWRWSGGENVQRFRRPRTTTRGRRTCMLASSSLLAAPLVGVPAGRAGPAPAPPRQVTASPASLFWSVLRLLHALGVAPQLLFAPCPAGGGAADRVHAHGRRRRVAPDRPPAASVSAGRSQTLGTVAAGLALVSAGVGCCPPHSTPCRRCRNPWLFAAGWVAALVALGFAVAGKLPRPAGRGGGSPSPASPTPSDWPGRPTTTRSRGKTFLAQGPRNGVRRPPQRWPPSTPATPSSTSAAPSPTCPMPPTSNLHCVAGRSSGVPDFPPLCRAETSRHGSSPKRQVRPLGRRGPGRRQAGAAGAG